MLVWNTDVAATSYAKPDDDQNRPIKKNYVTSHITHMSKRCTNNFLKIFGKDTK